MNFTSDVKIYTVMTPLWLAQKRRKHCISLKEAEGTKFYNFSLRKNIKSHHKKKLLSQRYFFFFYDPISQKNNKTQSLMQVITTRYKICKIFEGRSFPCKSSETFRDSKHDAWIFLERISSLRQETTVTASNNWTN